MWTPLRYASSCPHLHTDYYDFDPVNTILDKGEMHFKIGTFGVLTMGSTLRAGPQGVVYFVVQTINHKGHEGHKGKYKEIFVLFVSFVVNLN